MNIAQTLYDFSQAESAKTWYSLNDGVMGGISQSSFSYEAGHCVFQGAVSTANSGGFASVRTYNFEPPADLSAYQGWQLRVRGDGQRYKFLVRSEPTWESLAYSYSFDTVAGIWILIPITFTALRPVSRAKTISSAPSLKTRSIYSLQLMLSKFEYDGALNPHFTAGSFQLDLATISVYGAMP